MKYNKIFRMLALVIILALLMIAIPATPAMAAAISISPASGPVGTLVTVVGSGFIPGANVVIQFDALDRTPVITAWAGAFSTSITVPNVSSGLHQVRAVDALTNAPLGVSLPFTVTVTAEITIEPDEGAVGTEVEISGEGFDSREDIIVEYDSDEVDIEDGDDDTDSDGEFGDTIIIIPESTAGDHTITVIGDDSSFEAEAEFTVEPQITVSPTSGLVEVEVTITGTGFGRRSEIIVYFSNVEMAMSGDDETDRDGSFTATFSVPALDAGTYDVEVEDEDGNDGEAEFVIEEAVVVVTSISIAPVTGTAGTELTVTGTGFSGAVTVKYDDVEVVTATADDSGDFSATFTVPVSTGGDHTVTASDDTNEDSATFAVTAVADASLNLTAGNVGTGLTVTGTGFSGAVTVKYDGEAVATATADASGDFSATFSVPASTGGDHTVVISDGTATKQITFVMESVAPLPPVPLLPYMDSKIKAEEELSFDWKDVTDPSGVTYTLQIASDEDFTTIVLRQEVLVDSEYTVTEEERQLSITEETPYYWRVRAVDGASNMSVWTAPGSFYLSFPFVLPDWGKYTLMGLGALLIGLLGFWIGRRYAYSSF